MTGLAWTALAAAGAAAAGNWIAVARGLRPLEYVCKPLALALLVVVALALEPLSAAQRAWFVAALGASLAGDVLLMLPSAKTAPAGAAVPPAFVGGLGAFLGAHLAYLAGFAALGVTAAGLAVGAVVVVPAAATVGRTILRAAARAGDPLVTAALGGYLAVIGAMVVAAFGSGRPLAALGAAAFFVSDALIGWTRFVRPLPAAPIAIMVTYHLGQVGLVLSLPG